MNRFSYIFLLFPLTFKECLFHALKQKKYNVVAALVFVMDRFTYWQGSSHTTLQLVDYLKANSPDTPIAPQLLIRKVRIMKNKGNLQGSYQMHVASGLDLNNDKHLIYVFDSSFWLRPMRERGRHNCFSFRLLLSCDFPWLSQMEKLLAG